eukprot:PDM64201.1 hypothetical protein PRIPAC_54445 [Pristionchus pacificus]
MVNPHNADNEEAEVVVGGRVVVVVGGMDRGGRVVVDVGGFVWVVVGYLVVVFRVVVVVTVEVTVTGDVDESDGRTDVITVGLSTGGVTVEVDEDGTRHISFI